IAVTGDILRAKWRWFATEEGIEPADWLKLSDGWLSAFKKRHGLKGQRLHGEAASVNQAELEKERTALKQITDHYALRDSFNMDETGLFGKMPPNRTLATKQLSGRKKEKHRLSYAFTINADGSEKLAPLVIGRFANPRCFQGKKAKEYGHTYYWNLKSWMKSNIFQEYIEDLDCRMRRENRNILLLLDNFAGHKYDKDRITNIRVHFFPPNMTSHIQPLDQGIIQCFKMHYRRLFSERAILRQLTDIPPQELYNINVLEIMDLAKEAWSEVTSTTIKNCWRKAGIL
ncbi:DDE-domain-containing protein, partial [Calocera cornea HHB12733]